MAMALPRDPVSADVAEGERTVLIRQSEGGLMQEQSFL
jgi:hypothetical protein